MHNLFGLRDNEISSKSGMESAALGVIGE